MVNLIGILYFEDPLGCVDILTSPFDNIVLASVFFMFYKRKLNVEKIARCGLQCFFSLVMEARVFSSSYYYFLSSKRQQAHFLYSLPVILT
jgi:hypothetical protein